MFVSLPKSELCVWLQEAAECGQATGRLGSSPVNPEIGHNEAENQGVMLSEFSRSLLPLTLVSSQVSKGLISAALPVFLDRRMISELVKPISGSACTFPEEIEMSVLACIHTRELNSGQASSIQLLVKGNLFSNKTSFTISYIEKE